jgi:hypothetical protein
MVSVASFKDAAYQSALSGERAESIARWVLKECPTFMDDVPKEIKAQLDEGWALRWQEKNPAQRYTTDWVPSDKGNIDVTLAYCMSYSQQAFGQLKNEDPVKHGIIKAIRDKFNKYKKNRLDDLKVAVRRVLNEGATKTKTPTKGFDEYLKDTFDSIKARCKTAKARGDETATDEVKLRMAIDAFYKVIDA